MRVLFLAQSFGTHGGVERWLDLLVEGLLRQSIDCVVALADGEHHNAERYAAVHPVLPIVPLRSPTGAPSARLGAVRRVLRRLRPDVVVPVLLFDGLLGAALEKERLRCRIVYSLHGSNAGALQDLRDFSPILDSVVTVDRFTRDIIVEKGLAPGSLLRLVPCGVPAASRATELFASGEVRIGYCGRLEQAEKRVLDLVDLCLTLAALGIPYELAIAGGGSCEGQLAELVRTKLGEKAPVKFLGRRSPDWLYSSFYPNLDVLVVTSESEAGPLVAIEAMQHRCLVLSSDFLGRAAGGLLDAGVNCLVFPVGEMTAAAEQLAVAVSERALSQRIALAGYATAQSRTVEAMVVQWMELLHSVVAGKPRVAAVSPRAVELYRGASRLERLGLSPGLADFVRRGIGSKFRHETPSSEWPLSSVPDPDLAGVYERHRVKRVLR